MYSRNYGITEDQKSKITPPPDYSGSAIQSVGVTEKAANQNNEMNYEKEILSTSGFLSGLTVEDLILFGIIAALAFGVADNDMLVIALVIAVVIM